LYNLALIACLIAKQLDCIIALALSTGTSDYSAGAWVLMHGALIASVHGAAASQASVYVSWLLTDNNPLPGVEDV
jgi:hypothetical protein